MHRLFSNLPVKCVRGIRGKSILATRPPLKQEPVIDRSVLRETGENSFIRVLDRKNLSCAGDKISGGRSRGHKLMRVLPKGEPEYYFYKLPFYRGAFVKELVAGALARELLGEKAPMVYAVELPHEDESLSQYGLLSQSLGTKTYYDNLENWALLYKHDLEELQFGPRHLGYSLAFKLLLGDSDSKAANLVLLRDEEGQSYPIDNEYAFDMPIKFITDAGEAVKQLKDFDPTASEKNHIPLQADPELLALIHPVFEAAVQRSIDEGEVMRVYKRFADMSEIRLRGLFNLYGTLITEEERGDILKELIARQNATAKFVTERGDEAMLRAGRPQAGKSM